jgi:hypothetical protein
VFVSVISVAELSHWVAKVERKEAKQGEILRSWFEGVIVGGKERKSRRTFQLRIYQQKWGDLFACAG